MEIMEIVLPFKDYIKSLKRSEFFFDFGIPFLITTGTFGLLRSDFIIISNNQIENFTTLIINLLAIFIGFSMACLAIISSSDTQNIKDIKEKESDRKVDGKSITLFQLLLINYVHILMVEIILLMLNLFASLFSKYHDSCCYRNGYVLFNVLLLSHILFTSLRNSANYYHVFWKK